MRRCYLGAPILMCGWRGRYTTQILINKKERKRILDLFERVLVEAPLPAAKAPPGAAGSAEAEADTEPAPGDGDGGDDGPTGGPDGPAGDDGGPAGADDEAGEDAAGDDEDEGTGPAPHDV